MMIYFLIMLIAFGLSYAMTPVVRLFGIKMKIMDHPGGRKIHNVPKTRLGGLSIFISSAVAFYVAYKLHMFSGMYKNEFMGLMIGGSIVFAVGLIDDIIGLKPHLKLIGQLAAALVVVAYGIRATMFIENIYFASLITVVWIVVITNSFNLLDNMDGLSAGVGVISCLMFFLVYQRQGLLEINVLLFILMGALMGFLRFNFNPSKIFMGDSGSLFIGFLVAGVAVTGTYLEGSRLTHLPVITPLLILGVPIFDTLSVVYIRIKEGRSIFSADKSHFSHRLVSLGMSQKQAVLFIYLVSFCAGITSMLLPRLNKEDAIVILVQVLVVFAIIILLMVVKEGDLKKRTRKDKETRGENG